MADHNFQNAITSPDKKEHRVSDIINIVVLCFIFATVFVVLIFMKRGEVSQTEKRELTKFPAFSKDSYFSGAYTKGISLYFSDNVPFREMLLDTSSKLTAMMGVKLDNVSFHGVVIPPPQEDFSESAEVTQPSQTEASTTGDTSNTTTETTIVTEETVPPENGAEFITNGIIVVDDMGLMLFGGTQSQASRYATAINDYKLLFGPDINVYNLVVPTSAEFYMPKKYQHYTNSQKASIDYIYSKLSPDVIPVDAYSNIASHKDEKLYLKTDHHWSHLGAYYAYQAFAETAGVYAPPLSAYTEKVKEGYVGSLYGYTGNPVLKDNPEDFHYFLPPNSYTTYYYDYKNLNISTKGSLFYENVGSDAYYCMFLGTDAIHTKITTDVKNGRKIAVFKESYGNAFSTYLVSSFEEIYIIDIRYFNKNVVTYLKSNGITDVLFINNVFAANTSLLIGYIENLKYDKAPPPVTTTAPPLNTEPPESTTTEETSQTQPPETEPEAE